MRVLRRVPVYTIGVVLTVAIVAVTEAKNWSGLTLFLVALGAAAFYVITILVPFLMWEQGVERQPKTVTAPIGSGKTMLAASALANFHNELSLRVGRDVTIVRIRMQRANGEYVVIYETTQTAKLVPEPEAARGPVAVVASAPRLATN